jgi:hypothetical protein
MCARGCRTKANYQIFLRHAVSDQSTSTRARRQIDFAGGVLAMTVGFFTWLALLRHFDLSYMYPFEGLDRVLLAVAAWLILKEKIDTESLGRGDLNLSRNRICRRKLIFDCQGPTQSIRFGSISSPDELTELWAIDNSAAAVRLCSCPFVVHLSWTCAAGGRLYHWRSGAKHPRRR